MKSKLCGFLCSKLSGSYSGRVQRPLVVPIPKREQKMGLIGIPGLERELFQFLDFDSLLQLRAASKKFRGRCRVGRFSECVAGSCSRDWDAGKNVDPESMRWDKCWHVGSAGNLGRQGGE